MLVGTAPKTNHRRSEYGQTWQGLAELGDESRQNGGKTDKKGDCCCALRSENGACKR